MQERQRQQPTQAIQDLEPQSGLAAQALELLQRARNAEGDDRFKLAGNLNALLRRPVAETDREAWAQFLIEKLEDVGFHDLYDSEGLSCRAAAVEAVLGLGFPWALHLDPNDLEYLRTVRPGSSVSAGWRAMAVVTGVLAALFALAFFIHL